MRSIRVFLVNILLFIFGTSFLKKVRSVLMFWRVTLKHKAVDTKFIENNLTIFDDLKNQADAMNRPDLKSAMEECVGLLKNHQKE